jgi:hypothetical protein
LIGASFVGAGHRAHADNGGAFGAHMRVAPIYREARHAGAMREVRCAAGSSARCFVSG